MDDRIQKLRGANMDIDLATPADEIGWQQETCPWNAVDGAEGTPLRGQNYSICSYFCGVEYLDTLLCSYPHEIRWPDVTIYIVYFPGNHPIGKGFDVDENSKANPENFELDYWRHHGSLFTGSTGDRSGLHPRQCYQRQVGRRWRRT